MTAPAAAAGDPGLVHSLLDRLATEWGADAHRDEIASAREDFFNRAGKVFEEDAELFEARLAAFLEWYLIERPFRGGPPPVLQTLAAAHDEPVRNRLALAHIAASHRSLFDLAAVEGHAVTIEDVLGGARFVVTERRSTVGFNVGDIVEARLVWDGREVVFAKTFLFHPREARDDILDVVDAALGKGTPRDEIMFHLSRLHVRWHHQGHVNASRIYRG